MGAYFELQVYSVLRLLGCDVEVHPSFAGTHGKVDFGVTHGEDRFYVEATVCGIGQGTLRSNANEEDAVRKIRQSILCPHSDVWLQSEGELITTLGKRRLVGPVQELLASYSPDAVLDLANMHMWRRPQTSIQEGNWILNVFLRPIASSNGKGQVRGPCRGGTIDGASPIVKVLKNKAKDWADKKCDDATFVIAANVCHSEYSPGDELRAIYGHSDPNIGQDKFSQSLSRVAGVLVIANVTLGQERSAMVRLYENTDKGAPECLQFLQHEKSFGGLIGLA